MHCPRCGQEQLNEEIRFCSRCGFLLTGIVEVMANGGNLPMSAAAEKGVSTPRKRGLKKGLFIFLLAFLFVPLATIFTIMVEAEHPFFVVIIAILLTVGGLLRMAYAMMFESNAPSEQILEGNVYQKAQSLLNKRQNIKSLPAEQSIPASSYSPPTGGNWRDTNDLTPASVTESTTKLLQKD
ncbi:MAG TPA: zinc ribbon domain-containing protein [Pyrinomonadaceae bacterium]|jgi:hypothetical protein